MDKRIPPLLILRCSRLLSKSSGGPRYSANAMLWAVEEADMFVSNIMSHVSLLSPTLAVNLKLMDISSHMEEEEAKEDAWELLDQALRFWEEIHQEAHAVFLEVGPNARGVARLDKKLIIHGVLLLQERICTDARIYAEGIDPNSQASHPAVEMSMRGPILFSGQGEPAVPDECSSSTFSCRRSGEMPEYLLSRDYFPFLLEAGVLAHPVGGALRAGAAGCRTASSRGGPTPLPVSSLPLLSLPFIGRGHGA